MSVVIESAATSAVKRVTCIKRGLELTDQLDRGHQLSRPEQEQLAMAFRVALEKWLEESR